MQAMMNFSRFFHENFNVIWCVAIFLGLWSVLAQAYRFVNFIYAKLIRKRKNFQERYGKGTWVLITGSSQGIGKAFAHAFAKQGFNILLSARTQSKLKQVQEQIKSLYPNIQVKYIVIDLLKSIDKQQIQSTWYKINKLSQLDIGIVVNNAGIDYLDKMCDQEFKTLFKMVEMDCLVVNSIQYLFMEKWLKEEKNDQEKKRRLIINVSSLCAESPISNFAVYNASKIYVDRLTQGCAKEHPQMDFMALRPSEVSTKMTAFKKDIFTIQPHQCVQPLLDDLGYQVISHGNFFHAIQSWLYLTVPFWLFTLLWQGIFLKEFKKARVEFKEKSEKSK